MTSSIDQPKAILEELCRLAEKAGARAMRYYRGGATVTLKSDASPLTDADRASHEFLVQHLPPLISNVPVISEESQDVTINFEKACERFWLVDPLDGTKEFLKGTGEFTVNIALIDQQRPVIGVVHAPAIGLTYFADLKNGAFRRNQSEVPVSI